MERKKTKKEKDSFSLYTLISIQRGIVCDWLEVIITIIVQLPSEEIPAEVFKSGGVMRM